MFGLPEKYLSFVKHQKIAQNYNLEFAVYEGGQHIVARRKLKRNQKLNNFLFKSGSAGLKVK